MENVQHERINRTAPDDIHLPTKIKALQDATPRWIINAV